jgi:long-chain acyl-CoA synthetase
VGAAVDEARAGLAELGVRKGDMVAVISRNRLEWVQTAYGGYGLGAVNVPM